MEIYEPNVGKINYDTLLGNGKYYYDKVSGKYYPNNTNSLHDKNFDGGLTLNDCEGMTISNCTFTGVETAVKFNYKEEKHMITHVQVDDFPFTITVNRNSILDALNQASAKLTNLSGRTSWTLVADGNVEVTQTASTLRAKTVQVVDANGNVHVPDAKGVLVPVTAAS